LFGTAAGEKEEAQNSRYANYDAGLVEKGFHQLLYFRSDKFN
jgi:hypothetical protein